MSEEEKQSLKEMMLMDSTCIAGMKFGWNCCATGSQELFDQTVENIRNQIVEAAMEINSK